MTPLLGIKELRSPSRVSRMGGGIRSIVQTLPDHLSAGTCVRAPRRHLDERQTHLLVEREMIERPSPGASFAIGDRLLARDKDKTQRRDAAD